MFIISLRLSIPVGLCKYIFYASGVFPFRLCEQILCRVVETVVVVVVVVVLARLNWFALTWLVAPLSFCFCWW